MSNPIKKTSKVESWDEVRIRLEVALDKVKNHNQNEFDKIYNIKDYIPKFKNYDDFL